MTLAPDTPTPTPPAEEPVDPAPAREPLRLPGIAIALAIALTAPAVAPAQAAQGIALMVALYAFAAVARFASPYLHFDADRKAALMGAALLAAPFVLTVFAARSLPVAALGIAGQHAGAVTWLAGVAVFAVVALSARPIDVLPTLRVVAIVGAAYSITSIVQTLGMVPASTTGWGSAGGGLENSLSLVQLLLVALGCAIAWTIASQNPLQQSAALVCSVLIAAGAILSGSLGAWVGIAVGVGVFALLMTSERLSWPPRTVAIAGVATSAVLLALCIAIALGAFGPTAFTRADDIANGRFAQWRSAATTIMREPLAIRGPEAFSAWVSWGPRSDGGFDTQGSSDPHNVVIASAYAGGLIGLSAFLLGAVWLIRSLVESLRREQGDTVIAAALAGLAALAAMLLTSWVSPSALVAGAAVAGVIVGATRQPAPATSVVKAGVLIAAATCAIAAALLYAPVSAEWRFAQQSRTGSPARAATEAWQRQPDQAIYANTALFELVGRASNGDADARSVAETILNSFGESRGHNVDLAASAAVLALSDPDGSSDERWERFTEALDAGRRIDPTSGLWDYLEQQGAQSEGR